MTTMTRYLAAGSVVALLATFSVGAQAQDTVRDRSSMENNGGSCVGVECLPGGNDRDRVNRPEGSDRTQRGKDMDQNEKIKRNDRRVDSNDDNDRVNSKREARSDWKFDPNRHHRSRNKDSRYRYYYGGYWYLEPYWTIPLYGLSRVSCGEGRDIVDDSGFNRVRTIECSGRTYTYAARRHGDIYRVSLNSRTGEIVSVRPM